MAKPAAAEKRQRRERGSINPDDIIKGAFELAERVGIDNLSMPLLGKHLGVGVTSIYWYFRKKDDLLNAMTDRALKQYVFATPYVEAKDWRETLRNHARTMKDVPGNLILRDPILTVRTEPKPSSEWWRWRRRSRAWSRLGCRPRTPSTRIPRCRYTCAVRLCCSASTTGKPIPYDPIKLYEDDGEPNNAMVVAYAVLHDQTINIADAYAERGFDFSGTIAARLIEDPSSAKSARRNVASARRAGASPARRADPGPLRPRPPRHHPGRRPRTSRRRRCRHPGAGARRRAW